MHISARYFAHFLILALSLCVVPTLAQELTPKAEADKLIGELGAAIQLKSWDIVITKANRILELFPRSGDVLVSRGIAHQSIGKVDSAIDDYSKALTFPTSRTLEVTARRMRGILYTNSNKLELAISDYDYLVLKEPAKFEHRFFRGLCHFKLKNYELAIADHEHIYNTDTKAKFTRRFLAASFLFVGKNEKAIESIDLELQSTENIHPECYKIRSEAYRKIGKIDLADADLAKYNGLIKESDKKLPN